MLDHPVEHISTQGGAVKYNWRLLAGLATNPVQNLDAIWYQLSKANAGWNGEVQIPKELSYSAINTVESINFLLFMLATHWLMKCPELCSSAKGFSVMRDDDQSCLVWGEGGGRPLTRLTFDPGAAAWTPHDKSQILLENIGAGVFSDALASLARSYLSVIETADWQSLMFDNYFTIRLV